ncbi:MAG TPA: GDCCVxC domain-containing (seleno)protein [Anaerolineae bacterium]|nr:GDCCVxC domain-containing (seleno)protein [Anaerolineae bacterium]
MNIILQSNLTCPECEFIQTVEMPTNACQFFYACVNCGQTLKPKAGDCCVFCSYGDVPCPPKQLEKHETSHYPRH